MTSLATPLSNASPSTATSPIDLSGTIPFGSVRACGRGGCVKVPLRMHRSMLVLVILVAINGILNISVDIGMGLAIFVYGTVGIFGTVLVHELGHLYVALCMGFEAHPIILWPLGGVGTIANLPKRHSQRVLIALAGPLTHVPMMLFWWALFHGVLGCSLGPANFRNHNVPGLTRQEDVNYKCVLDHVNACFAASPISNCVDANEVNAAGGLSQCIGFTEEYLMSCPSQAPCNLPDMNNALHCMDVYTVVSGACSLVATSGAISSQAFEECLADLSSTLRSCVTGHCTFDAVKQEFEIVNKDVWLFFVVLFGSMYEFNFYMLLFNCLIPIVPLDGATIFVSSLLGCGVSKVRVGFIALVCCVVCLLALIGQIAAFAIISNGRNFSSFQLFVCFYLAWHTQRLYSAYKSGKLSEHEMFGPETMVATPVICSHSITTAGTLAPSTQPQVNTGASTSTPASSGSFTESWFKKAAKPTKPAPPPSLPSANNNPFFQTNSV